ncbi:MAG: hypothetical protein Q7R22_004290 [Verrucomicrobiota bacterium JB025]|nr:hypothetical protein [Verrucomicrobiota bacterium JB025]
MKISSQIRNLFPADVVPPFHIQLTLPRREVGYLRIGARSIFQQVDEKISVGVGIRSLLKR